MKTAETLGKVGLPAPLKTLCARSWDAIIVGAGHNGLTCAAYLARAGKRVLVLESRERVGGACTLEEMAPGVRVSPCAYVIGLLHPLVLQELKLKENGFRWVPATGGSFIPFEDGTSLWRPYEDELAIKEVKRFAPQDYEGWTRMKATVSRLREAIRPQGDRDLWIGKAPTREQLLERLEGDTEARKLLLEWSMAEFVEHYLTDERMQMAYLGQGIIGTNASPYHPGTSSIYFHHASGRMDGLEGTWGYVLGGMGNLSFLLCDIASKLGATIASGVAVAAIHPGEGVELAGGEKLSAPIIISNADPQTTLELLGPHADPAWARRVQAIPMKGCVAKLNALLRELPNFKARPGTLEPHHYGQINTPLSKRDFHECFLTAEAGQLPKRVWTEIYLQTPHDPSVAPTGMHTMSVFSQYFPYQFKEGSWETRRKEVSQVILNSIAPFCTNLPEVLVQEETLGPPDIEAKVGLKGGHIFQGECLPENMWDKRLGASTPMQGIYLCGAGTHPGGSVMGINGRNAAMEVLESSSPSVLG